MRSQRLNSKALAYASTSLGAAMMHSVFMFYYVHVYLSHFHVSEEGFQTAQIIFLVWNAINDPLFGYIQEYCKGKLLLKSRRHSILFGAPFFVISFLIPWIPWRDYNDPANQWLSAVQLTVSLCLYDALFTFVLLAQCSLSAELSTRHVDRIKLIRYSQVASLIGASSVFFTGLYSANLEEYHNFLKICVVIAVLAFICLTYTGTHAFTEYDDKELTQDNVEINVANHKIDEVPSSPLSPSTKEGFILETTQTAKSDELTLRNMASQICQICSQHSFLSFVFMNFCQVYYSAFLANFTNIFCETLVSKEDLPSAARSAYFGLVTLLPQVSSVIIRYLVTAIKE